MRPEHLTEVELENYALNRAECSDFQTIEEHLLLCPECREDLGLFEEEIRILRQTLRFVEPEERRQRAIRRKPGSLFLVPRP